MKFMFENNDVIFSENNEQIHQYSVNANKIEVLFNDIDINNYTPYISFLRADDKTSPLIGMSFGEVVINAIGKRGAVYNFTDEWVTGVAGELKFNIVLKNGNTVINTGVITLYVNESVDNDKITYIDSVAYSALVDRIGVIEQNYVSNEVFGNTVNSLNGSVNELTSSVDMLNHSVTQLNQNKADYRYVDEGFENINENFVNKTELADAEYVNLETLNDAIYSVEEEISYGGRKYVYVNGLTASNTIQDLLDYLSDFNLFDETKEYKYYLQFSDGAILENIYIKRYIVNPYRKIKYGITSLIRTATKIDIYIGAIDEENLSTTTINDLITQHKQIATVQDLADLVNSAPSTLDTLGELAQAFSENKEVVDALNEAIANKADKSYVDDADQQLMVGMIGVSQMLDNQKANKTDVYTKVEVDEKIANIVVSGGSGTGGSIGLYKHYINFYVSGDDYEYAIKLELYLERKEKIQDFVTLINYINKNANYHCLIQDTGDTMHYYSGSIYFDTNLLHIGFMAIDDVFIEKTIYYNFIEDYYNSVEDSVFKITSGGGASSGSSIQKEIIQIPQNYFTIETSELSDQSRHFSLTAYLNEDYMLDNKIIYMDCEQEQALYDISLGTLDNIVFNLSNNSDGTRPKNCTFYAKFKCSYDSLEYYRLYDAPYWTIEVPFMWQYIPDIKNAINQNGTFATTAWYDVQVEGANFIDGDSYISFYSNNLTDNIINGFVLKIEIDNDYFTTFSILPQYEM